MSDFRQRLETDLAAIRTAIADGRLEEARRMIIGIALNASPASEWSKEIGDLYLELGFPAMAGRYWYLLEDQSDQMIAACDEFERSLGANPVLILNAVGFVRNAPPHARTKLLDLRRKATALRQEHQYPWKPAKRWRDRVALLGCAFVGFVVMFIFVMGITFIIKLVGESH